MQKDRHLSSKQFKLKALLLKFEIGFYISSAKFLYKKENTYSTTKMDAVGSSEK
jgi:hypothetical protein